MNIHKLVSSSKQGVKAGIYSSPTCLSVLFWLLHPIQIKTLPKLENRSEIIRDSGLPRNIDRFFLGKGHPDEPQLCPSLTLVCPTDERLGPDPGQVNAGLLFKVADQVLDLGFNEAKPLDGLVGGGYDDQEMIELVKYMTSLKNQIIIK